MGAREACSTPFNRYKLPAPPPLAKGKSEKDIRRPRGGSGCSSLRGREGQAGASGRGRRAGRAGRESASPRGGFGLLDADEAVTVPVQFRELRRRAEPFPQGHV